MKEPLSFFRISYKVWNEFSQEQFYDINSITGFVRERYSLDNKRLGNRRKSIILDDTLVDVMRINKCHHYYRHRQTRFEHIKFMIKSSSRFRWSYEPYAIDTDAVYALIDGHVAARAAFPLEKFDLNGPLTIAQNGVLFTFEASKLAKSMISLHDNPSCGFRLPDLQKGKLQPLDNPKQLSPNFITHVYNALNELDAKKTSMSDQEIIGFLEELEITLAQSYYHEYRSGADLSDVDQVAADDLIEFFQYLSLRQYLDILKIQGVFCNYSIDDVQKNNLSVMLKRNTQQENLADSERLDIYKKESETWLRKAYDHINRSTDQEEKEALAQRYIKALKFANKHVFQMHFHPDKTTDEQLQKSRTQILYKLNQEIDAEVVKLEKSALPPPETNTTSSKNQGRFSWLSDFIKARDAYMEMLYPTRPAPPIPSERECLEGVRWYFDKSVKESLCNDVNQGQLRDFTQVQRQTLVEKTSACEYLQEFFEHPLKDVMCVSKDLHAKLNDANLNFQDHQFYLNLHYLMRYLPIMERTLELKGCYGGTYKGEISNAIIGLFPASVLAQLVNEMMAIYDSKKTRPHERAQLRFMMDDIVRHQMGKVFLDVRYLKNTVIHVHQRFPNEPIWDRIFGVVLLLTSALLISATMAAIFAPAWFVFGLNALMGISLIAEGAIPTAAVVASGTSLSLATATCGIFYARNQPFLRANYYLQIKATAHSLTVHSRYEYAATTEFARQSQQEFLRLFEDIREDYEAGAPNSNLWIRLK